MLLFQSQRLWQKQRHSHTGKAISFDLSAVLALTWACVYQHNQVIFIYIYLLDYVGHPFCIILMILYICIFVLVVTLED